MPTYLDLAAWPRRDVFEFFRDFDKPYFNVCVRLDVTILLSFLRSRPRPEISLAYHYFALRVANQIEPFRYRLSGGRVSVYEMINGGTTVLLPGGSFCLAYFDYHADFDKFLSEARLAVDRARDEGTFHPEEDDARIHFTVLPWLRFTSFSHARNWRREDSIPKMAFGGFAEENGRTLLPFSVEVHHALMDGSDVGRYVSALEAALADPEANIS